MKGVFFVMAILLVFDCCLARRGGGGGGGGEGGERPCRKQKKKALCLQIASLQRANNELENQNAELQNQIAELATGPSTSTGELRLVPGATYGGRVEVNVNGEWGTVCDDAWELEDANVVCRQLGFSRALSSHQGDHYGPGTGTIFLDDVQCTGSEASIFDCPSLSEHNCSHNEDAGVDCI